MGPAQAWAGQTLAIPQQLDGQEVALPGPRHALRAQFDALCPAADIKLRVRAAVDAMTMRRLIARDSGWLTVLPEVVVQDELRAGLLLRVGQFIELKENFYAINTTRPLGQMLLSGHSPWPVIDPVWPFSPAGVMPESSPWRRASKQEESQRRRPIQCSGLSHAPGTASRHSRLTPPPHR